MHKLNVKQFLEVNSTVSPVRPFSSFIKILFSLLLLFFFSSKTTSLPTFARCFRRTFLPRCPFVCFGLLGLWFGFHYKVTDVYYYCWCFEQHNFTIISMATLHLSTNTAREIFFILLHKSAEGRYNFYFTSTNVHTKKGSHALLSSSHAQWSKLNNDNAVYIYIITLDCNAVWLLDGNT